MARVVSIKNTKRLSSIVSRVPGLRQQPHAVQGFQPCWQWHKEGQQYLTGEQTAPFTHRQKHKSGFKICFLRLVIGHINAISRFLHKSLLWSFHSIYDTSIYIQYIKHKNSNCPHENMSIISSLMNLFNVIASAACDRFGIARGKIRMWLLQKCQHANSPSLVTARTYINKHTTTRWRLSLMLMTPCSLIILIQPQKRPHTVSIPLPTHTGSTDCVQELRYDILANSLGCSCVLHQWA